MWRALFKKAQVSGENLPTTKSGSSTVVLLAKCMCNMKAYNGQVDVLVGYEDLMALSKRISLCCFKLIEILWVQPMSDYHRLRYSLACKKP